MVKRWFMSHDVACFEKLRDLGVEFISPGKAPNDQERFVQTIKKANVCINFHSDKLLIISANQQLNRKGNISLDISQLFLQFLVVEVVAFPLLVLEGILTNSNSTNHLLHVPHRCYR